jgi:thioredoxin 1
MLLHKFNWKKEVMQANEPVLVDFWASWCPPCRAMNPVIEALAREFKVCKVNVETNQELAAHYGLFDTSHLDLQGREDCGPARGRDPRGYSAGRDAEAEPAVMPAAVPL